MSDIKSQKLIEQGNRLETVRRHFNLSQKALSQIVEANQTGVSVVIGGKRKIPRYWLVKLEQKYTQLNIDWLVSGQGDMLKDIKSNDGGGTGPASTLEILPSKEGNGRTLTNDEMERMMARMAFRIEELEDWKMAQEEWRQEMEMWREQMTKHIGRVLGYLNEIDGLKKAGKWPEK